MLCPMRTIYSVIILMAIGYSVAAQNVGVSTQTPKYRFHLSGGADNAPVTFGLGFSDLFGEPILKFVPAATNYLSLGFSGGSSVTGNIAEGFVLTRTGYVGIGNSTPQHPLSVGPVSGDAQGVTFRSYGNHGASWKGSGAFGYTGSTVILGELNGAAHLGGHNPTLSAWADLFINSGGGNVGIGVASITAGNRFEVGGAAKFNGQMNLSGYKIINVATPTAGTDGVNKDYVDNAIGGSDDWDKTGNNLYPKNPTTTNVGIGTATPTGKFQVAGNHDAGIMQDANDRPSIAATGGYPQLVLMSGNITNANHGPTIMLGGYDNAASGAHKHWSIGTAQNSTFLDIGYYAGTDLNPHNGIRNYGSNTLMTILSSGNVGISQTNPAYRLDVSGGIRATDKFYGRYFLWDTRNDNFGPDNYNNEMALEFKIASVIDASGSTYGGLMTIAPWGDNSGGLHHQLYFNDSGIGYRTGSPDNTTWNAWGRLLTTAGGTSSYLPKFNAAGSLTNSAIFDNGTNIGIGTASPAAPMHMYQDRYTLYGPNSSWGANLQVGGNGRVTTGASVAATNGNLHIDAADGSFATYINWYSQNNTFINGQSGLVGIGTASPSHKLHINSASGNANTLRLTSGNGLSNAKLNFGDAEYVYLHEHTDDHLWLKANSVTLQGYLYPTGAGSYNCGDASRYFYSVYADDHNYKGVWGYTFDTYDDLELLNNIQSDTYWDEKLGHHIMVIKPETLPKCITNYSDPDYNPAEPFVSLKKSNGLLIGAIRQLDREGKERDERLAIRTEMLANALGYSYDNLEEIVQTINDFGSASAASSEVRVEYTIGFAQKLTNGQLPVVQITPNGSYEKYYVASKDATGFTLVVEGAQPGFQFDWVAMAKVKVAVEGDKHIDDVFYKTPVEITGSYPTIQIPNTLVVPPTKTVEK